jgi:protein MAK11
LYHSWLTASQDKMGLGAGAAGDLTAAGLNLSVGCYDATVVGLHLGVEEDGLLAMEARFAYAAHAGAVRALALSGGTLASGSSDETVRVYDVRRRHEVAVLVHHAGSVNALEFARDPVSGADFLFSASDDASICVTRASDWRLVKKLAGHTSPVVDFAVHPSSRVALSIARDRSLFMWNLIKGKVAFSAKTKPGPASAVQWSPSGSSYMLTAENRVALYDPEGQLLANIMHEAPVLSAAYLDEQRIVTGGEDKTVRIWDLRSGNVCATPAVHDVRVRAVAAVSGLVASADSSGGLKIWDEARGGGPRLETSIGGGGMRLTRMAFASARGPEGQVRSRDRARKHIEREELEARDSENDSESIPEAEAGAKRATRLRKSSGKTRVTNKETIVGDKIIDKVGTASSRKRRKRKDSLIK